MSPQKTITEPARQTPIIAEADVVVLGGGPAGITAAVAAARNGARTLLVERYGFLGGNGTIAMVTNFAGMHAILDGEIHQLVHGIADDILARIDHFGGLNAVHTVLGKTAAQAYDVAAYKLAADDLLMGAGVDILFHCLAVGAVVEDDAITALLVENKSGRGAIRGSYFIDCSGDGDLAYFAGAAWDKGDDDGFIQYPTQMFRVNHVDDQLALNEGKPNLSKLMQDAAASGKWAFTRTSGVINPQKHSGEWRVNLTQIPGPKGGPLDGTDVFDLTYGEIEGRRQVQNIFSFLKSEVPGFKDSYLLEIAPQVGIRETRRVRGQYTLTVDDVLQARDFDDTIGISGWPIERHTQGHVEWRWIEGRGYHQIPFRCQIPLTLDNLLIAGRCASLTSEAQAATRVSGPCFAMGQAAGTAAAINVKGGIVARDTDITALQRQLEIDGANLGR